MNQLLAISPIDGRYSEKLTQLQTISSEFGLIKYRLRVEIAWFKYLFSIDGINLPALGHDELVLLNKIYEDFDIVACLRVKEIEQTTNHDVKALEYYIKEQIIECPKLNKYKEFIHFACTSEDINNLSYALMLTDIRDLVVNNEILELLHIVEGIAKRYKETSMVARTHGQSATPTTVGKEFYNVYYRMKRQLEQLQKQEILGKINGAVGNYNAHIVAFPTLNWPLFAKNFVENILGLTFNPFTTQIEPHDYMAELFANVARINTILIGFARDIWTYISLGYFKQKLSANEVGSSTMPHKINPIDFENCEGNLGLANAMLNHLIEKLPISRLQRDLSDSTVQRNIGVAFAYGVLAYKSLIKGLGKLEINYEVIKQDLENNYELLGEAIQTVMRKNLISNAYEQLKSLTRGKKIDQEQLKNFIMNLSDITSEDKERLLQLDIKDYIGLANKLF